MTIGRSYGSMPAGAGPYGGVVPGSDNVCPQVVFMSPAPDSLGIPIRPVVEFDVIDFEGNLNVNAIRGFVDGISVFDSSQTQKFFRGWSGEVTTIDFGVHVRMQPSDPLPSGSMVELQVTARDTSDNRANKVWTFTTVPPTSVTSVEILGNRCLRLGFSTGLRVNGELYRPSNYGFGVRLGYAEPIYAKTVTSPSDVADTLVSSVIVCMRNYFSLNGRYSVRVQGVIDEFGRVVDTGHSSFIVR